MSLQLTHTALHGRNRSIIAPRRALTRDVFEMPTEGERIGYARVSTEDQSLELQVEALKAAGCLNIYTEKVSGAKSHRPELDLAIKDLRKHDTLVVWRLDRLSRTIRDLYKRIDEIRAAGASFVSLQERIDFSTPAGKVMLGMIALMAEFERNVTQERTKAGMAVLREKGYRLGARVKFDAKAQREARRLVAMRERRSVGGKSVWRAKHSKVSIAKKLKISTGTLHAFLRSSKR